MPSIAKLTLDQLRLKVAAGPTPAGVAVAAVAASLALSLIAMSLEVSAGKKSATGSRVALGRMRRAAARESLRMLDYADRDVAAFNAYLKSRRRGARRGGPDAALARAIETPLKIARAAFAALELCAQAAPLVRRAVAADLGTGAAMLAAAARAAARSAESNLRYVAPGNPARKRVIAERRVLERRAGAMVQRILKIVG
jgi:formiminotetrahydrofolate cyclodeaminase